MATPARRLRTTIRTTSDRYGHLYDAARDRLRAHLQDAYTEANSSAA
jgi:hypothetical protein